MRPTVPTFHALPCARALVALALLLLVPLCASAQRVRWQPPGGSLALRQTSQLSLIFEDCEPTGNFTLPAIPNLTIGEGSRGEQSSFNIVNGEATRSRTVYFTYPVRPDNRDPIRIPSFTVETDRGPMQVPAAEFTVGEATIGNSSIPLDSAAGSRVTIGRGQLWAGEVVPVTYVLSVANRYPASYAGGPEWNPAPLLVEDWSKPEPGTALINGENRNTITYQTRGYVRTPGTHTIEPLGQRVNLRVPSSNFSIFQAFQAEQYTITSNSPQLVVRPLPTPAPRGFNGAVGKFELTSQVVPEQAVVGEPITWTLTLAGTGNWPDIPGLPPRDVSRDFRVVQPRAQRTPAEGKLFDATLSEDVVLIPTKPGSYQLGPITWSYFDPELGRYESITVAPKTVEVTAPAATGTGSPDTPQQAVQDTPSATAPRVAATPAPEAPGRIPRDPLTTEDATRVPWGFGEMLWHTFAPWIAVPLVWLALAMRRAARHDPHRGAREARRRLAVTLRNLASADDPLQRRRLLHAWQRDTAVLWGVRRAAPSSQAFAADPSWMTLWAESERALFGGAALPDDWISRAQQALDARPATRFRARSALRSRNLIPIALLVLGLAVGIQSMRADAGQEAYQQGDFRAAEKHWRGQIERAPTQWATHHNLALALAQQERWPEAAAHAIAAFVQQPSHPSVRWHLGYTLARSGYAPRDLAAFADPDVVHTAAAWLSPAGWQRVFAAAGASLAVAAILALLRLYRIGNRWFGGIAAVLVVAAILSAATALIALPRYGLAADARAVLFWRSTPLRSLPTDLSTDQQSSTLAPGTLAIIDKEFLGWRRLTFPNGQTGWVRVGEYLPLWAGDVKADAARQEGS